jgi:hypothetical protein
MKRVCIIIIAIIMGSIACSTFSIVPDELVQTAIAKTEVSERTIIASTQEYRNTIIAQTQVFENSVNTAVARTQTAFPQHQTPTATLTFTLTPTPSPTRVPFTRTPTKPPTNIPQPPPKPQGGPIDINGYCRHEGYIEAVLTDNTAYGWKCRAADGTLDGMTMWYACDWQYGGGTPQFVYSDPYSWTCVFP